ncbi:MAG: cytochrome c [Alphaproteobacteria bacterium]
MSGKNGASRIGDPGAGIRAVIAVAAFAIVFGAAGAAQTVQAADPAAVARGETSTPPIHSLGENPAVQQTVVPLTGGTRALLQTPVTTQSPGGISTRPNIKNPVAGDPAAARRGMTYFNSFNCVGCHAPNGGGGMGRSLSNGFFQYGGEPANVYLSILQGRPNGMPAWGGLLPDAVIWDLVAYIEQISKAPNPQWGTTVSATHPSIEQVPAEFQTSVNPWAFTQPFSGGRKPSGGQGK